LREKSHIDDMRSAIRGDFERLAERRGGQELMRPPSEQPEEQPGEPEPAAEPELAPTGAPAAEPELEELPPRDAGPEPEPVADDAASDESVAEEPRRRSWLDRLLGR
jgi:hypothetical protein